MIRVIGELESAGLVFEDKIYAENYLTYNTTWGMLKKSLNLSLKYRTRSLIDLKFEEVVNLGLIEFHYRRANSILINTLEHQLKVGISSAYQSMDHNEREMYCNSVREYILNKKNAYINSVRNTRFKNLNNLILYIKSSTFDVFKIFDVLYFIDIAELYNKLNYHYRVTEIYLEINKIRNIVYHHDQILRVFPARKASKQYNFKSQFHRIVYNNRFDNNVSVRDVHTIDNMKKKTYLLAQLALLDSAIKLLSQSESTDKIKKKVFDEYFKEIQEAEDKIKKTHNIAPWLISLTNIILAYKSNYSSSDAADLTVGL